MKYIAIISFLFFCLSCTEEGKVVNERFNHSGKELTLSLINTKEYPLDEETSYLTSYLQYIDTDSMAQLCFMNTYNNSIYMYEAVSGEFNKKITFQKEGDNGVNDLQGFYFINNDSIYVYSYRTNILYLADQEAEIRSKMTMYDATESNENYFLPSPYLQTRSPLKGFKDKLYCGGFVSGENLIETTENRPVITAVDYNNKNKAYRVNYPKQYADYNWAGGFAYRMPFFDLDSSSLIVSFAADHHLARVNLVDETNESYYAGSSKIEHIKSFPQSKTRPINEDEMFDWYMSNASYEGVFYDRYRQLYYRIARLPSKNHVSGTRQNNKPIIIVVLDKNLKYLGEVSLPKEIRYHTSNCYVSKEGFNIQVLTDDENKLTFYQYLFI